MHDTVLVIFNKSLTEKEKQKLHRQSGYSTVIAPRELCAHITELGKKIVCLEDFLEPGSIYEARVFVEELSLMTLQDGTQITKAFTYKGYELWWMYYQKIYLYACLPYTQYRKLLRHLRDFNCVYLYEPPFRDLFSLYFEAYGVNTHIRKKIRFKSPTWFPLGVVIQFGITLVSLPLLILRRPSLLVFTGDTFEKNRDYDFRMKFIYEELRKRNIPFVEFIRSVQPWKAIIQNVFVRKRPVVYLDAIASCGRFVSAITHGHSRVQKKLRSRIFSSKTDAETHFKLLLASQFLLEVQNDVWAIRMTQWIVRVIGIKAAYITAANDRNFHTVLGCKLHNIPTVGILHGFASRDYNVYDFLPTYTGEKSLSVDTYGVWSDWWKEYYIEHGRAYKEEQLVVSGPMRPLEKKDNIRPEKQASGLLKVLFVSEQLAVPEEVLPYLKALLDTKNILVYIKFRPYRDGFELWLTQHCPEILSSISEDRILRGQMQEAIALCDTVVGSHSTAVLEALLVEKPVVFFATHKWGDYFSLQGYHPRFTFYAENEEAFIKSVECARDIPDMVLRDLEKRFFGDAYLNGSKWVVDQLATLLESK